jgi:flavorubredoxin
MGNLPAILDEFPMTKCVGDLRNYHLYYPDHVSRFINSSKGDVIDLGDGQIKMLPAVIHDLPNTLWAYHDTSRVLFVSDGFVYSHGHARDECARMTSELSWQPSLSEMIPAIFGALHWARFVDCNALFDEFDHLIESLSVRGIAPAHGNYVDNPNVIAPLVRSAMVAARSYS